MLLPVCMAGTTNHLVVEMTLPHSTILAASCSHATQLTVLVHWVTDPVDTSITADSLVEGIHQNDFEVFIDRVLANPVRVEHSKTTKISPSTLLGHRSETPLKLQVINTLVGRFTISCSLGYWPLATTTANTNTIDYIALFGFVTQATSLIRTSWSGCTVNSIQLAILPASHTKQKPQKVRLLFLVELFKVLVGSHCPATEIQLQGFTNFPIHVTKSLMANIQ